MIREKMVVRPARAGARAVGDELSNGDLRRAKFAQRYSINRELRIAGGSPPSSGLEGATCSASARAVVSRQMRVQLCESLTSRRTWSFWEYSLIPGSPLVGNTKNGSKKQ